MRPCACCGKSSRFYGDDGRLFCSDECEVAQIRLERAAPDLLKALRGLAGSDAQDEEHPCFCWDSNSARVIGHASYCERARAAIAKATRSTP